MSLFAKTRNLYGRFERPISSLSLLSGFVFDALTLKRLDTLWENLWIIGHLLIVGVFIVLIHLKERGEGDEHNPNKAHFWFVNILQFVFGGTLSTFLVFYFRSTDIWITWPFLLILAIAFLANESLKKHYVRLSFQISLFFLSIYSFAIFALPVLLHKIDKEVFIFSGLASLFFIAIFIKILFYFLKDRFKGSKKLVILLVLGIFIIVNFLYFTNLIPPIPLSLKDGDVYHSIIKNKSGDYDVTYEDYGWKGYFKLYPDFHKTESAPVYAFSAIFSPRDLDLGIIHEWQYRDTVKNKWITQSKIPLQIIGGRDSGFRTYSMRSNLEQGKWRVNIKTTEGQTIGSIRMNIINTDIEPELTDDVQE